MMKTIRLILILGAVLALGVTSCKKGDTGPAGPVGPAGPDSVVYSSWKTLSFTVNEDTVSVDTVIAPSITQAILDSGVILTYYNLASSSSPADLVTGSSMISLNVYEDYSLGEINIESFQYNFDGIQMRYVTIPGSKLETVNSVKRYKGYTIADLKAMPYDKASKIVGGATN